jgi:hypothetical protein
MSVGIIQGNVAVVSVVSVTFNPASVAANTTAEQAMTVTGAQVGDLVFVRKPTLSAGLGIAGARVSAADTVQVTFVNATASPIDAGSETYLVLVVRPDATVTQVLA